MGSGDMLSLGAHADVLCESGLKSILDSFPNPVAHSFPDHFQSSL